MTDTETKPAKKHRHSYRKDGTCACGRKNQGRVGAPTTIDPKALAPKLLEYFDRKPYETGYEQVASNKTVLSLERKVPCDFPTVAGFCVQEDVSKSRLYELAGDRDEATEQLKNPALADALKRAKDFQENILVINTMHGLYEKAFAIFAAKNLIDWRDTQHLDHTSKGESLNRRVAPETTKLVNRILEKAAHADSPKHTPTNQ